MKVFVFKPTNALIGKFEIEGLDSIAAGLNEFARSHEVGPYDYLECSGHTWTLVDSPGGHGLIEGRVQRPRQQDSESGDAASSSAKRTVPKSASFVGNYREAYRIGAAAVGFGAVIKSVGYILGFVSLFLGFIAAAQTGGDGALLFVVLGLIGGALQVVVFMIFGVLVSAVGQILRSTLDTAVHTSPFLDLQEKAQVMEGWTKRS